MSRRSKQLTEENNIDNHVSTLMAEIKLKEDAFEVEKNQLNIDNQCLKKKIVSMEKDLDNLNSKVSLHNFLLILKIIFSHICKFVDISICSKRSFH